MPNVFMVAAFSLMYGFLVSSFTQIKLGESMVI